MLRSGFFQDKGGEMYKRLQTRLAVDEYAARRLITQNLLVEKWCSHVPDAINMSNDQHVDWHFNELMGSPLKLEFYLMRCGVKTEYCTEVHLVVRQNEPLDSKAFEACMSILESLRYKTNKDWVIKDTDLNAAVFRSN